MSSRSAALGIVLVVLLLKAGVCVGGDQNHALQSRPVLGVGGEVPASLRGVWGVVSRHMAV